VINLHVTYDIPLVTYIMAPTVSRPVCLGIRPPFWIREQFFFLTHGICLKKAAVLFFLWDILSDKRPGLLFSQSETVVVSPLSVSIPTRILNI
jgi:hypothetical protein